MTLSRLRDVVGVALIGTLLGYSLSHIGFSSWDEVHAMFTFRHVRMLFVFVIALALLVPTWVIIAKLSRPHWTPRPIHRGTLAGGVLFGIGWALSGACPSIAAVQVGEGQLGGIVTFVGIFAGNFLYSIAHERFFRWSSGSCLDD